MNCRYVQSRLAAYLDRELSPNERAAVRAHLSECAACQSDFAEAERIKNTIASLSSIEPSEQFERRLFEAVHSAAPKSAARETVGWGLAVVPAVAAIAGYLLFVFTRPPEAVVQSVPTSAQSDTLARDQAFDQARNPFSAGTVVSFEGTNGR
jgi:anti-sigma factor RsiW